VENHRDFETKKEALAFLKKHALMSVGWPEGKKQKVAIYWNGRLHVEDAKTKKYWGSNRMNRQRIAQELVAVVRELTARDVNVEYLQQMEDDIQRRLDNLRKHVKKYGRRSQGALNKATRAMSQAVSYLNEAQMIHITENDPLGG